MRGAASGDKLSYETKGKRISSVNSGVPLENQMNGGIVQQKRQYRRREFHLGEMKNEFNFGKH